MGMLDIDDLEAARRLGMPELPRTLTVRTPGGGRHVYFTHSAVSRALGNYFAIVVDGKPVVEFKGHNVAVCAPGCVRQDGGKYETELDLPITDLPFEWVAWLLRNAPPGRTTPGHAIGIEVADDFEFDDFCNFFEIEIAQVHGIWHSPSFCPIKGEPHRNDGKRDVTACAFSWDEKNRTLGWKDHAASCDGATMNVRDVIRFLEEQKGEKYTNDIFKDAFDADRFPVEEIMPQENEKHILADDEIKQILTVPPEPVIDTSDFTFKDQDTGNGERLVKKFGHCIRWIAEINEWMVWGEKGWRKDTGGTLMRMTKAILKEIAAEALGGDEPDKAKLKHAQISGKLERRKAMIVSAGYERGVFSNIAEWDSDGWLLSVNNGIIQLKTQEFRQRTRADLCMKQSPVDYNADATCPTWEAAMEKWCCADHELIDYLQTACGVSLTSDTSLQAIFFNQGSGENGKDTFFGILRYVMGSYCQNVSFNTFVETKYGHSEHRNDLAALAGAVRIVTAAETSDGHCLDEGVIKSVTGGPEARITCRQIHGRPFTYTPQFKPWFMSNYEPVIKGGDWGIWRRVKKIPWEYTLTPEEKDPFFADKIKAEASGILNWMLAGLRRYIDLGHKLPTCRAVEDATAQYRHDMDIVGRFIEDRLTIRPTATVLGKEVYKSYVSWCGENGHRALSSRRLNSEIVRHCGGKVKKDRGDEGVIFNGLGMLTDGVYPEPDWIT